ncbi:hypothetical protein V1478_008472 [Vespula squamosa]|uniref:Uncharacterized protein n=1 Tax=Vespula squamosa TaxID=30214 RepID=A0ABD2ATL8_VESSQ
MAKIERNAFSCAASSSQIFDFRFQERVSVEIIVSASILKLEAFLTWRSTSKSGRHTNVVIIAFCDKFYDD